MKTNEDQKLVWMLAVATLSYAEYLSWVGSRGFLARSEHTPASA